MPLPSGTRLGPYEIVGPLGAGGMGEVYRARDSRLSREVALKTLPADFARDAGRLARFHREAQTLAALNHPNIAAIYGLEDSAGSPLLVLELVEGESLAERLLRGPLAVPEAIALCGQIAAAIEAAHERGVVHRDLKPANVMITPAGSAKVLDFGLATQAGAAEPASSHPDAATLTAHAGATLPGTILGTAAYMSPEQARGRPVDRRSDVWSFGCVLFECLAGRPVFAGETVSDLVARILEREPDWTALPAGTPARVRELLKRCLRKPADDRPRDIRDVRLELADAAAAGRADTGAREQSIAVLPFENQGGADDEYFADGMTDEILNALAHVDGLRVAARTSCFAFKGRREDLRVVAGKLDVATVLEGTVRRAGQRLRITVQLVDAGGGFQLWSERYDRELTDVFAVQDEIAAAVAARFAVAPAAAAVPRGRHGAGGLEAYELLHRGRALQFQRGGSITEAIRCFERVIELDPGNAEAMALLSDSWRLMGTYGIAPAGDVMPRARRAAEQALAIDPDIAEAWAVIADVEAQYDRDPVRAAASWARALAADPRHSRSRCERSLWLNAHGAMDGEEMVADTARAVADDPLNAWVVGMHSWALAYAGRSDEAVAEAERALTLDPGSFHAHWNLLRALGFAGQFARAIELGRPMLATGGRSTWFLGTLGWLYAKNAQPEHATAIYRELEARSRLEFVMPFWLVITASSAGLSDDAERLARRAVAERDPLTVLARTVPLWDAARALPWFDEVTKGVWG